MKLAINGFGRIGRAVYRIIAERPSSGIGIVAVNDLAADDKLAHLLKYDTVFGRFPGDIVVDNRVMSAGGHTVRMLEERDPAQLLLGRPLECAVVRRGFRSERSRRLSSPSCTIR